MTSNNEFYKMTIERLKKYRYLHNRSSEYYSRMHRYIMAPSVTITALSGIGSFLSISHIVSSNIQSGFGLAVPRSVARGFSGRPQRGTDEAQFAVPLGVLGSSL